MSRLSEKKYKGTIQINKNNSLISNERIVSEKTKYLHLGQSDRDDDQDVKIRF